MNDIAMHVKVASIDIQMCIFRHTSLSQCYGKEKGNYITAKRMNYLGKIL